jgi:transposase
MEDSPMARTLLTDELWNVIEPLLPKHPPTRKGGRPRIPDRDALRGVLFVLRTGIAWEDLPLEMGCGCGMTCWRRLAEWQEAGIWDEILQTILSLLRAADKLDLSRAIVDSTSVRAVFGGRSPARTPRIEAKVEASITSSRKPRASRLRPRSAQPMHTT